MVEGAGAGASLPLRSVSSSIVTRGRFAGVSVMVVVVNVVVIIVVVVVIIIIIGCCCLFTAPK